MNAARPRMMFARTRRELVSGMKTVIRRAGWWNTKPGDEIDAIDADGNVLGTITVTSVRREPLAAMTNADVADEGFPGKSAEWFINAFCGRPGITPKTIVMAISFDFRASPSRQLKMFE